MMGYVFYLYCEMNCLIFQKMEAFEELEDFGCFILDGKLERLRY